MNAVLADEAVVIMQTRPDGGDWHAFLDPVQVPLAPLTLPHLLLHAHLFSIRCLAQGVVDALPQLYERVEFSLHLLCICSELFVRSVVCFFDFPQNCLAPFVRFGHKRVTLCLHLQERSG